MIEVATVQDKTTRQHESENLIYNIPQLKSSVWCKKNQIFLQELNDGVQRFRFFSKDFSDYEASKPSNKAKAHTTGYEVY
ncbi:MAG: hypothetical protein MUF15_22110 [Acidobacteria bacterium]|jgi:hypothetical protein|nr:hypothetical protein [Acidobacteriota bacterium]